LSTSVNTANLSPDWKQEVNRRIAAHRNNKAPLAANSRGMEGYRSALGSRAAEAAARVARRYAQAPSYSAMLADEAHAAVRAAEAAAKAAQDAQAAVQFMLEDLEAAASAPESATTVSHARLEILEPVLPVPDSSLPEFHELDERPQFSPLIQSSPRIQFSPAIEREESFETRDELRGADQPIYANLIEFPREMVATRRMRPRLAEGPLAAALGQAQLSIFEVDPGTISTEAAPTINQPAAPAWMRAEFATIAVEPQSEEDFLDQRAPQSQSPKPIRLAPLGRRSMALVVDASLVLAVFVFLAAQFASHAKQMPGPHLVEFGAVIAVLVISAAYHWLFLTLTKATPGMRYAGIALCTFDGHSPSREYRSRRLTGLLLSVLPLGLGLVWAFFDEDHLTWHDRLSKTYLRRR
jgi:uncharacterized RDD family membrane protein YckC